MTLSDRAVTNEDTVTATRDADTVARPTIDRRLCNHRARSRLPVLGRRCALGRR